MVKSHSLGFEILTGPGNTYAAMPGLRFKLPLNLKKIYESFKINLAETNCDDSWTLLTPARIITSKGGLIEKIEANPDSITRPEPNSTILKLKNLNSLSR